ncbi:MAG: DMT family transporter [Deltaproteobacteria bacterium]|nr:DMT family transporter [Deltaproteobacteria bacterium]
MSAHEQRLGLLFAGLCALNGAFVPAVAQLTTAGTDPLAVATVTSLFAGVAALVVLAVRGEIGVLLRGPQVKRLLVVAALGTALAFFLFFEGAKRTTAIQTALCLQTEPAYALIVARVFLGHPMTLRRIASSALALSGIALALGPSRIEASSGLVLLLLTPLAWQTSHVVVLRGLRGISPEVLTGARYVFGGAMLAVVLAIREILGGDDVRGALDGIGAVLPFVVVQGVVLSYFGTAVWYQAITRLDLARTTAIVVPSVPLLSFLVSFLVLGEVASMQQWLGLMMTAAGVLAFVTAPHAEAAPEIAKSAIRVKAAR